MEELRRLIEQAHAEVRAKAIDDFLKEANGQLYDARQNTFTANDVWYLLTCVSNKLKAGSTHE